MSPFESVCKFTIHDRRMLLEINNSLSFFDRQEVRRQPFSFLFLSYNYEKHFKAALKLYFKFGTCPSIWSPFHFIEFHFILNVTGQVRHFYRDIVSKNGWPLVKPTYPKANPNLFWGRILGSILQEFLVPYRACFLFRISLLYTF